MTKITPQPGIMDIAPYQGGASHVDGVANILKLSSNENPSGPPQAAKDAIVKAAQTMHRYPSTDHLELREAIAATHGIDAQNIVCGAGSDELIALMCQAYAGPGDEVIHTEHGFGMYRISALAAGATPVEVREHHRATSVKAILDACTDRTRLVFIANPNNPTGTMISEARIKALAAGLPKQAILVLDGAYADYVEDYDGGAALVGARQNVVMTRTFSKLYALGGLRIGWAFAPDHIVDVLNRVRGPFNISAPALAGALAAIKDKDFAKNALAENAKWRAWLADALANIGVVSDVSYANFILARFKSEQEAMECNEFLRAQGVLVRPVAGYNLPNCLRITVGDEAGSRRVAHVIKQFKEQPDEL